MQYTLTLKVASFRNEFRLFLSTLRNGSTSSGMFLASLVLVICWYLLQFLFAWSPIPLTADQAGALLLFIL